MAYISPKWLIVEFLRHRLTDPRSRAESATSDTFTATASQTSFTLTPTTGSKLSCVTSVTDDGNAQAKNVDYWVDLKNLKVIFFTGITESNEVIVNYKEGAGDANSKNYNWIYPDMPRINLDRTSFPRISITKISDSGIRAGSKDAPIFNTARFQASIWVKQPIAGEIYTIGGIKYAGHDLAEYLAYEIVAAFRDYIDDLNRALWNFQCAGPIDMPFDYDFQLHQTVVDFTLKGTDMGVVQSG
jgi:hypothetical protein